MALKTSDVNKGNRNHLEKLKILKTKRGSKLGKTTS
jgi:hypothetical protein